MGYLTTVNEVNALVNELNGEIPCPGNLPGNTRVFCFDEGDGFITAHEVNEDGTVKSLSEYAIFAFVPKRETHKEHKMTRKEAQEFNRRSQFQNGREVISLHLQYDAGSDSEGNFRDGYTVTMTSSDTGEIETVCKFQGYVQAHEKYREYAKLIFDHVFQA